MFADNSFERNRKIERVTPEVLEDFARLVVEYETTPSEKTMFPLLKDLVDRRRREIESHLKDDEKPGVEAIVVRRVAELHMERLKREAQKKEEEESGRIRQNEFLDDFTFQERLKRLGEEAGSTEFAREAFRYKHR